MIGFADPGSARRAIAVLEEADKFFRQTDVAGGTRPGAFALVVPGDPAAAGSDWSPGMVWKFNDSDDADAMAATEIQPCYLRDLWLKKLPTGNPILFAVFTGYRLVAAIDAVAKRPTFRTVGPWPIKKQKIVTQVALVNCCVQWTWKEAWVLDFPVP